MMSISLASDIKEIMGLHKQCVEHEITIKNLQDEKEIMKQFYKDQIIKLVDEISDLKKNSGISLRDHFAGLALQSLINVYVNTKDETPPDYYLAGWSYRMAEAMLEHKDKRHA